MENRSRLLVAICLAQLSEEEIDIMVDEAIATTGAVNIRDMGKVMGEIKSKAQGRADMGIVGAKVKTRLNV